MAHYAIFDPVALVYSFSEITLLRSTLREVKKLHPFLMLAYVFLPDHFHLLIRPNGPSTFSAIMQSLKSYFTYAYKNEIGINGSMRFWQKRFYDHIIRDEADLRRHLDYIHYNPVRHGFVTKPEDWPHSSFEDWRQRGCYAERWGWILPEAIADFGNDSE